MQNNKIYSSNHLKIFDKIITKKRSQIVDIINDQIILNNINEVLDIGTTNDTKNKSSNFIVKNLKNVKNFYSISDQLITSSFFKKTLQKSITENFSEYEIENLKSDLVISNATIEHVGNYDNQKVMINNMIKLSKKMIIISTPNRYHPFEFHTKIPFIHWLPKNIHRKILKSIGLPFFSKEENLNLLSKSDFNSFVENEKLKSEFRYIKFLFLKSNLIFIGKKI
tara:strand:- start:5 stop:676 length:672 start_codon:yes stop_codon:yes gene_type:complete